MENPQAPMCVCWACSVGVMGLEVGTGGGCMGKNQRVWHISKHICFMSCWCNGEDWAGGNRRGSKGREGVSVWIFYFIELKE